jgi:hypothetical protein
MAFARGTVLGGAQARGLLSTALAGSCQAGSRAYGIADPGNLVGKAAGGAQLAAAAAYAAPLAGRAAGAARARGLLHPGGQILGRARGAGRIAGGLTLGLKSGVRGAAQLRGALAVALSGQCQAGATARGRAAPGNLVGAVRGLGQAAATETTSRFFLQFSPGRARAFGGAR